MQRGCWLAMVGALAVLPGGACALDAAASFVAPPGAPRAADEPPQPLGERAPPRAALPPPPAPPPAAPGADPQGVSLILREVRIEGGEGLPLQGLPEVYRPYLGRQATLADLEQIRYALTKHLVDLGYVNSGAVLTSVRTGEAGSATFLIVTGRLSEVRISGHAGLREGYIRERVLPDPDAPLSRDALQDRFQLLLDDPLIERMEGTLLPGLEPGSAILDLKVMRARPWDAYLRVDNYHPPSTGSEFFYLGGALRNLTGQGDVLEVLAGLGLQGGNGLQDRGKQGSIGYSIPVTAQDTRVFVRYDRTNASLLEEPIRNLDIESDTQRVEIGVSHPWWRTPRRIFNLGALAGWAENATTLLGEPFSFSPGAVRGESRASVVRLYQEYLDRAERRAFALRSVFSLGVDALDATIHDDGLPDGRFFVWLGQGQYVGTLDARGTQLVLRGAVQWADQVLLPLERYAVGGYNTVRGYRENELVGDSGYAGSIEVRYPLWRGALWGSPTNLLQGAVFTDFGSAWSHTRFDRRQDLFSAGVGLRWNMNDKLRAEVYVAHAFQEPLPKDDYDWQDDGIHFMIEAEL